MAITTQVVTVGTAAVTLASPTVDAQALWIENLEPANLMGDYSRNGNVYVVSQNFTLANNGTALFSFTTGDTGAQFEFWTFDSSNSSYTGELIEGATIVTTGSAIAGYNLNRTKSDAHQAVLLGATSLTGGTTILTEYVGASNQAAGGTFSSKIITLEPNTEYGFRFIDVGGVGTKVYLQIGWAEIFNGYNDVWLNGTEGNTVRLRGGDKVQFELQQGEGLTALGGRDGIRVAVMRQD